jgi:hypothetical protein
MAFGPKRGYSDRLERRHIENIRAAAGFAHEVGHPLNLCIDINWSRTGLEDDPDGRVLNKLMELRRKWLKRHDVAVFAQVGIRENPTRPYPCPNAHVLLHCPQPLMASFGAWFLEAATRLCWHLDQGAIRFGTVGNGNSTVKAALGRLRYMSKGVSSRVAKRFGIDPEPQGRIYGKRVSISQDINHAARQRYAAARGAQGLQLHGATGIGRHTVSGEVAVAGLHSSALTATSPHVGLDTSWRTDEVHPQSLSTPANLVAAHALACHVSLG